jgi:serine/threonine protein kinase
MQPLPRIPGYELLQLLGGGPLTRVYSARDCAADTLCAVKLLREDWDDPQTAIKLLQREARAGLTVRHARLVRVRDAHVTRPPYFLVMELLPGESARQRLDRDYRLETADVLWIIRQTAEALAALHAAGFVHGDVKPENIRLTADGNAVLIDLGFAHRPGENAAFLSQGYVLGTINYLAPELCFPIPDGDFASDVFSLGLTFYELLVGRLPYATESVADMFRLRREHRSGDFALRIGPPALARIIERLLAPQPAQRPRAAALVPQLVALEINTLKQRRSA